MKLNVGGIMPTITIEGPKIDDIEIKRNLVKELTEAAVKAYGFPIEVFVVYIKENPIENVGVGGKLISDQREGK
jgi:4-oxalocrotonate tautomerase